MSCWLLLACRSVLQQPLRITVGARNTAASSVSQRLTFVGRENGKLMALRQLLTEGLKPPVLVFVASKVSEALHNAFTCVTLVVPPPLPLPLAGLSQGAASISLPLSRLWCSLDGCASTLHQSHASGHTCRGWGQGAASRARVQQLRVNSITADQSALSSNHTCI